jgi:hypothetical protein
MADNPSSPGHKEKTVVPTLVPRDAFVVMLLRGFEEMIAGIPSGSLSQSSCNLLAHSEVTLALSFDLSIK